MDVITTHINADFDALACLLAAKKLYPQARVVLPGLAERNVREFLTLYRYVLELDKEKNIDFTKVSRLIMVDTRDAGRIGGLGKLIGKSDLVIHTYDHHPPGASEVKSDQDVSRPVGATVSILVDILKKKQVPLTPIEATLLVLGIYEDTGSLTFSSTSPEDLNAVTYLLSCGASLNLVSDFINRQLKDEQVKVLEKMIQATENILINNVSVAISAVKLSKYVLDLALLTHKLRDMENLNVVFTVVEMGSTIHLVGRSRAPEVDVAGVLSEFGGGGHTTAASAAVKGSTLEETVAKLKKVLTKKIKKPVTAKSIMSSPVKTIEDKTSIEETHRLMLRFAHNCLPITRQDKIVGIITREDVDKALYHGFGQFPVSGYMRRNVFSIKSATPVYEIQEIMLEHDIGHLPVMEGHKLVGMVSRTDLLRFMHQEMVTGDSNYNHFEHNSLQIENVKKLINEQLPRQIRELLLKIGEVGDEMGYPVFIIGGFVRDLLLKVENFDVDIVVEGDGIIFARALGKKLRGEVKSHEKFGTAVVTLEDAFKIDIATARKEFYEFPAALPTVEYSSIKQDLYRRDFTINAMAIRLNPANFGELLDFFGGQKDLRQGNIKVLYNLSFVEDPTRIIRAIRFEQRYGFKMDSDTETFIRHALSLDLFDKLANQRVRDELILILSEDEPFKAVQRMNDFSILKYVHPSLKVTPALKNNFAAVNDTLFLFGLHLLGKKLERWFIYFLILTEKLSLDELNSMGERLKFTRKNIEHMVLAKQKANLLVKSLSKAKNMPDSAVYRTVHEVPLEILIFVMTKSRNKLIKKRISHYLTKLNKVKIEINGDDLKKLGFKEGPEFKKILDSVLAAKLDRKISSREEELKFVIDYYSKNR
ncbi:MAG: CBS domain-containing protein [bacterium]